MEWHSQWFVVANWQDAFQVMTGVRQGCLLSSFLFLLAINWVLKTSTAQRGYEIQRTTWLQLVDLDFADDLALLSHIQERMQEKTSKVADNSACLGLKDHGGKNLVPKNSRAINTTPITLDGDALEVTSFTYLGSMVETQGGGGEGGGGLTLM